MGAATAQWSVPQNVESAGTGAAQNENDWTIRRANSVAWGGFAFDGTCDGAAHSDGAELATLYLVGGRVPLGGASGAGGAGGGGGGNSGSVLSRFEMASPVVIAIDMAMMTSVTPSGGVMSGSDSLLPSPLSTSAPSPSPTVVSPTAVPAVATATTAPTTTGSPSPTQAPSGSPTPSVSTTPSVSLTPSASPVPVYCALM